MTSVTYLKLINVPTVFDIGCPVSDPSSDNLTLNMVDEKSFRIERQEFLSRVRKFKVEKIEKFKSAMKAIHTNLSVSETVIYPHGIVRNDTTKQSGFFSTMFSGSKDKSDDPKQSGDTGSNTIYEELKIPAGVTFTPMINQIPIYIDGIEYTEEAKKIVVKRLKKDNVHVSVPIVTYLPLKMDDLPNLHF